MGHVTRDVPDLQSAFYEAAANPDGWSRTLGQFATAFRSRGCLLTTPHFMPGSIPHSSGMKDVLDQFFSQGWHNRDLRTRLGLAKRRSDGFFSDDDLLTREEMEQSSYYRDFARDAGVPWFSAAILSQEVDGDFIAVSLQRSATEGAFTLSEQAQLNAVLPELRNAAHIAVRLAALRGRSLVEGLDLASEAAILIGRHGRVLHLNDHARRLGEPILKLICNRVEAQGGTSASALPGLIARARAALLSASDMGFDLSPVVVRSPAGKPVAVARAAPIRRSGSDLLGFEGVILLIKALDDPQPFDSRLVRETFGLTSREVQVASLIGELPTLEAVGQRLDISREAVRFHLKSIFLKTGTHRQSELMQLLAKLARKCN